ncbi:lipid A deacylase LpxR family protein [Cellulophaga sp. HaHaR_3_176]|uniref:lipid A deacylase LpxR family protein n=1 Tax=Cellulophaga sp. HaHaR_3_176 TaxID=1942464 RepID=UPI001C1FD861|nr:lipid A deacylase LpxR family protein [Cellulophaga sp. HaHaR_3_176]QWX84903.1 lipid A deacylase LpxR family protein [Cellulophaga sp. HaHaR_3_176]
MKIKIYKLIFLLVLPNILISQKIDNLTSFREIKSDSYFRFSYENDFFSATDRDYTQGYSLEFVNSKLEKNPINHLFFNLDKSNYKYGISIEHIGFTPNNYVSSEIQFGDRPFSSAIMLKSFNIAIDSIRKRRIAQTFSLGLIGPGAFGKEMQVEIHKVTGNKIPGGWDNQIKNDLVINYKVDYEKQLIRYTDLFALQANSSMQLGTLFSNASVGFNTQIGIINSPFTLNKPEKAFRLYAYAQPIVKVVGYDATLQGGVFNKESVYNISSGSIERFTAQFNYGIVIKTKTLYFEYSKSFITKEFNSGNSAKWGGFKIGFTL